MSQKQRYLWFLVWVMRAVAYGMVILSLPYFFGNFSPEIKAEPFGSNAYAALGMLFSPLLLAGLAEILALLSVAKSSRNDT